MKEETKPVLLVLAAWFCVALAGGIGGWFQNFGAAGVAIMVWLLTALALLLAWRVWVVHTWALTVDMKWLIALHLTRFVGIYFLLLASRGELSSAFARPAGWSDIAVASLALLLTVIPLLRNSRELLLVWNVFGLIDILFVVSSALHFGRIDLDSMLPLRVLPLSLLPTFFVPLIIASHVLIFVRLRRSS
jgi:hypothetical protein